MKEIINYYKYELLAVLVLLVCLMVVTKPYFDVKAAPPDPTPRYERIMYERTGDDNFVHYFEVWHDRASGQEVACALTKLDDAARNISCWPTGRKW